MPTETDIKEILREGKLNFLPLVLRSTKQDFATELGIQIDDVIKIVWTEEYLFAVEIKASNTPKAIREAIDAALRVSQAIPDAHPLIVVPYLSETQLNELEASGVSGIDLSGNGIVVVPAKLFVRKTGMPNAYPQSAPIRNVYDGASSLVPRVLFARPEYASVNEVFAEISRRGGSIVLSTVSKVLKKLQEDLIISREGAVRLVQADKLLDNFLQNYRAPKVRARWTGKIALDEKELITQAMATASKLGGRAVLTGTWSGLRLAVSGQEPMVSMYTTISPERMAAVIGIQATDRFPTIELLWTDDPAPYFDMRLRDGLPLAAPIQCYLELARGEKRLREISEQLLPLVLAPSSTSEGSTK